MPMLFARIVEVLGLRWEWIGFDRGKAGLPDSKIGTNAMPLPPPLLPARSPQPGHPPIRSATPR